VPAVTFVESSDEHAETKAEAPVPSSVTNEMKGKFFTVVEIPSFVASRTAASSYGSLHRRPSSQGYWVSPHWPHFHRATGPDFARARGSPLARIIAEDNRLTMMRSARGRWGRHEQWGLSENAALKNEFAHGMATMSSGETLSGAGSFARGGRRHGKFE
jgi:hypothetical protein